MFINFPAGIANNDTSFFLYIGRTCVYNRPILRGLFQTSIERQRLYVFVVLRFSALTHVNIKNSFQNCARKYTTRIGRWHWDESRTNACQWLPFPALPKKLERTPAIGEPWVTSQQPNNHATMEPQFWLKGLRDDKDFRWVKRHSFIWCGAMLTIFPEGNNWPTAQKIH